MYIYLSKYVQKKTPVLHADFITTMSVETYINFRTRPLAAHFEQLAPRLSILMQVRWIDIHVFQWRKHKNMSNIFRLINPVHVMDTYIFKVNLFTKQAIYE